MANYLSQVDQIRYVKDPSTTGVPGIALGGGGTYGNSQPATTIVDGFVHIPIMTGPPTGVPTLLTGYVPIVFDSAGNKFWAYLNGAWKGVVLA